MNDLPETWRLLIETLLHAPVAWQTPAALACALGWNLEATSDVLALLDEAGLLETWECEPSPVVTLSPLAAARLGVRLVEAGLRGELRWLAQGDPEPRPARARLSCVHAQAIVLQSVPDPHPSPDLVAERAELQERKARKWARADADEAALDDDPPWPTLLLGLSLTPWPGPRRKGDEGKLCPVCGTVYLQPNMYCLLCDRWGFDELMRRRSPSRRPRSGTSDLHERREALEIEKERANRKARRRARFAAQAEAQAEELHKRRNGTHDSGSSHQAGPHGHRG